MNESEKPRELTHEEMEAMLRAKEEIMRGWPRKIDVDGRKYSVRQIPKGIRSKIHGLEIEAYHVSHLLKEPATPRKAKRLQRKLDRLHVKTAAYYLLGKKALIPGVFWLTWRRLSLRPEKDIAMINNTAINNEEINFSSANWEITEIQLALSMRPIGDGVRKALKRWESASEQAKEDATKKKEEDAMSTASSRKAQKMKR